jgi:pimeloyl-ACP methyl ester carboxylesterase
MVDRVGSSPMTTDILARHNVTVFGRGTQPIVFVHGFGCDQQMWRFITPPSRPTATRLAGLHPADGLIGINRGPGRRMRPTPWVVSP